MTWNHDRPTHPIMKKLINAPFPILVIVVILGGALVKEFDFTAFRFGDPPLALVYLFSLGLALYFIFRRDRKGTDS